MRLFFALEIDEKTRQSLADAMLQLRQQAIGGRWTRPENLHVTVQFLGELPPESLPELSGMLRRSADSVRPFHLVFGGCGTFGSRRDILWIGIEPCKMLQQLFGLITTELAGASLPHEKRLYQPHLTIARQIRLPDGHLPAWPGPHIRCPIRHFTLMESRRQDGRPVYRAVLREPLQGDTESGDGTVANPGSTGQAG